MMSPLTLLPRKWIIHLCTIVQGAKKDATLILHFSFAGQMAMRPRLDWQLTLGHFFFWVANTHFCISCTSLHFFSISEFNAFYLLLCIVDVSHLSFTATAWTRKREVSSN